jgi:hypothetical protein
VERLYFTDAPSVIQLAGEGEMRTLTRVIEVKVWVGECDECLMFDCDDVMNVWLLVMHVWLIVIVVHVCSSNSIVRFCPRPL